MNEIETTITDIGHCSSLVELLRHRAAYSPDETAFIYIADNGESKQTMNYGELDRLARCIAARLQRDSAPGERALLLYPSGLEFIAAFFGCLYAGVIAVPAYPPRDNRNGERMRILADDVQAKLFLSTTAQKGNIERRLHINGTDATIEVLASDLLHDGEDEWQEYRPAADDLAFIQYTSGSSGKPKGVMVSHNNILHNEKVIHHAYGLSRKSMGVGWLPLFHDMGLIGNFLQPLYVGFPIILFSPSAFIQKPVMWLELISHYRATTSGGPNFAFDHCVSRITEEQKAGLDLSCWEVAFNGAEPVRKETMDRFAEAFAGCGFRKEAFYPCYGMAETTLFITGNKKLTAAKTACLNSTGTKAASAAASAREKVSCGFPRLDQKIVIVDPERLVATEDGQIGEIWTSGKSVTQGYWNRPEETEKIFKARLATGEGPFLRTGDLGFVSEGELFVTGRRKDLIIIRGRNYYPDDIEQTVGTCHPALKVGSGAAFPIELEGEERVVIVQEVERAALRKLNDAEVITAIRQSVAHQHELSVCAVVLIKTSSIPKTSSGKIQRHACKAGYLSGELENVAEWRQPSLQDLFQVMGSRKDAEQQPQTSFSDNARAKSGEELQQFIVQFLWGKISAALGMETGEPLTDQPLNTLGFDSLMFVDLTNKVHKETGLKISLAEVMDGLTLRDLASAVHDHLDSNPAAQQITLPELPVQQLTSPLDLTFDSAMADPGQLLANIHHLSDEEIDLLLKNMAARK